MKKTFENKRHIYKFKKDYSNGNIRTVVLSNLFYNSAYPSKELEIIGKTIYSNMTVPRGFFQYWCIYEDAALLHYYGKRDFTYEGNRQYKNYLFTINDSIFIVGGKTEVVLKDGKVDISAVVQFYKEYMQMIANYITYLHDSGTGEDYDKDAYTALMLARKEGYLDENNIMTMKEITIIDHCKNVLRSAYNNITSIRSA